MSQYFSDSVFPALDHKREDNQEIRHGFGAGEGPMVDPFVALCFSGGSAETGRRNRNVQSLYRIFVSGS
jgi:hypothetical protein